MSLGMSDKTGREGIGGGRSSGFTAAELGVTGAAWSSGSEVDDDLDKVSKEATES
jgi:hypothetical protein